MAKIVDDIFDHLESDIEKIRVRHRQYISYSNELGAKSVVMEIINNALDECRTPRSPGNKILIEYDEKSDTIIVEDNGRGIPTDLVEKIFTSLNMGSNIKTSNKASLKAETLGQNGTGSLAICGLAEEVTIISNRGGSENKTITIKFKEGVKVSESITDCERSNHGMRILYKPSKVMGSNTRIIWKDIETELLNFQYLNASNIKISSRYVDANNEEHSYDYKAQGFENILSRNDKELLATPLLLVSVSDDDIIEELDGESVKRYLQLDLAFAYTTSLNPYIDSFSNSNNTVDNGDHLEGAIEALCRYLQIFIRSGMSDKEKANLDIKWEDVKMGLSVAVSLKTNYESLYTGQTKHKVVSKEIRKIVTDLLIDEFHNFFGANNAMTKDIVSIIKMNARVRREGDKVRTAVVKSVLTNWSSFKMKNYDPCTNKGLKEYKELYIIEGGSAKGSLKLARDPVFQALFAIRGVSANVFKLTLDKIVGPQGNTEFNDLITVMGCNVGPKFDMQKLQFNKIIIASDADVDGLFIRSLLMAFFFKLFPEIIEDGRLFIAEPPLYRVDDKRNPFVINKEDYISRYVKSVIKKYRIQYITKEGSVILDKDTTTALLSETSSYVDDISLISDHYKVNDRLIEMIVEEFALVEYSLSNTDKIRSINIQDMMNHIRIEFPELQFDDRIKLIKGVVNSVYQSIEITELFVIKILPLVKILKKWGNNRVQRMILVDPVTESEHRLSLLGTLKILKKYQPNILHRFKGLGENDHDDIKTTIMDPNTRSLIKVNIVDIENDMKVFQTLRGTSPLDALNRKNMMKEFKISRDAIDT